MTNHPTKIAIPMKTTPTKNVAHPSPSDESTGVVRTAGVINEGITNLLTTVQPAGPT